MILEWYLWYSLAGYDCLWCARSVLDSIPAPGPGSDPDPGPDVSSSCLFIDFRAFEDPQRAPTSAFCGMRFEWILFCAATTEVSGTNRSHAHVIQTTGIKVSKWTFHSLLCIVPIRTDKRPIEGFKKGVKGRGFALHQRVYTNLKFTTKLVRSLHRLNSNGSDIMDDQEQFIA